MKKIDYEYINRYLNEDEKKLFEKLRRTDKFHSIRVSKDAIKYAEVATKFDNINEDILGKLGLLHDIGKIERPLNSIEKSIIVILNKLTKGKLKKYTNFKIIDSYYNHPIKGVNILGDFEYDKVFLEAIEKHHNKKINENNKLLNILKLCDDKN
ncbi:HDIG domain-containing protein [Clostridium cavendishii DSM 21758]|uniref:HDIG domain-containing protein n=1 Tax=Clostridium cavendishii DSM 21758 TaxID=1121302 RepID=A0A1M6VP56_9CLOT|nr:HD domain-containing protein [Clostridium cavendishii]SHK83273.1 HDIG domain-containing protein [Clostridium cavendishii DSM 21758]